jgi:hypothetical protein
VSTEPQAFTSEEGDQPTGGESPLSAARPAEDSPMDEHPELLVGAAFVGGFALAQILKRLGE